MHGTYIFQSETDNFTQLVSTFERWMDRKGDQNNWYKILLAMDENGEYKRQIEHSDWRGRDEYTDELVEKLDSGKDIQEYAWEIVAHDFFPSDRFSNLMGLSPDEEETEFEKTIKDLPLEDWEEFFVDNALPILKEDYQKLETDKLIKDEYDSFVNYRRRNRTRIFEAVVNSMQYDHAPFIDSGDPYDYRTFKLYSNGESDMKSYLFVDIHT